MAVQDPERISRFLLFSRWFSQTRVKVDAFLCSPYDQLSVSCTEELEEDHVWKVGRDTADARRTSLYGRADLKALHVREQKLEIERDDNPKYHANIVGWPGKAKEDQRLQALVLAANAGVPIFVPSET